MVIFLTEEAIYEVHDVNISETQSSNEVELTGAFEDTFVVNVEVSPEEMLRCWQIYLICVMQMVKMSLKINSLRNR